MELHDHVLRVVNGAPEGSRPVSVRDIARQLGISVELVLPVARRMVSDGEATPVTVSVDGIATLRGLRRSPATPPHDTSIS